MPRLDTIHNLDITTSVLVKAASFCGFVYVLGCTIIGWERCQIRNNFSVAAFWNIRSNFRGMYLPLWIYWIGGIRQNMRPCRQESRHFFSQHLRLAIGNLIQKRSCQWRLLNLIIPEMSGLSRGARCRDIFAVVLAQLKIRQSFMIFG